MKINAWWCMLLEKSPPSIMEGGDFPYSYLLYLYFTYF